MLITRSLLRFALGGDFLVSNINSAFHMIPFQDFNPLNETGFVAVSVDCDSIHTEFGPVFGSASACWSWLASPSGQDSVPCKSRHRRMYVWKLGIPF